MSSAADEPLPFDSLMLICAFRYALGRHTYVTGAAEEWVREFWPKLQAGTRDCIVRDLKRHIKDWGVSDDSCDMRGWKALLEWCEART